jgi:hypothetical protein
MLMFLLASFTPAKEDPAKTSLTSHTTSRMMRNYSKLVNNIDD